MKPATKEGDDFNHFHIDEMNGLVNQLNHQINRIVKGLPIEIENKNPFRHLSIEECSDVLFRVQLGLDAIKHYKRKNKLNKLRAFKFKTLLKRE